MDLPSAGVEVVGGPEDDVGGPAGGPYAYMAGMLDSVVYANRWDVRSVPQHLEMGCGPESHMLSVPHLVHVQWVVLMAQHWP
jgi:hypothetical protein